MQVQAVIHPATPQPKAHRAHAWAFLICFLFAFAVFFGRYPQNFTVPNFYSEDGIVFGKNVIEHPFILAMFSPFNGYCILGVYLLTGVASLLNGVLHGGAIGSLPQAIALTSYAFLAFCCALPILTLRHLVPLRWLIALAVINALVPVSGWGYAIFGTLGNLKFAFVYIALLLVIWRATGNPGRLQIYLIHFGIFICAYTNPTVYVLLPVLILPLAQEYWASRDWKVVFAKGRKYFVELGILGLLVVPQVLMVAVRGIPKLQGYMDTPFDPSMSINVFIARPLFFGIMYWCYGSLNDFSTLLLLGLFLASVVKYVRDPGLSACVISLATIWVMTGLFALNRPGVSSLLSNPYGRFGGGPAQFFYPQNWMFYLILVVVCASVSETRGRTGWRWGAPIVLSALFVIFSATSDTWRFRHTRIDPELGIKPVLSRACAAQSGDVIVFPVYPTPEQQMSLDRKRACGSF